LHCNRRGAREGFRGVDHGLPQALGDAIAQRRQQPRQPHAKAERLCFVRIQAQHLEEPALDFLGGESLAHAAAPPPLLEYPISRVQTQRHALQAQRLDAFIADVDAHRESPGAREELPVDLARGGEQLACSPGPRRRARRECLGSAPDHQGVLACFLLHVLGEERLEGGQRQAQRQRAAQITDRTAAEFLQQPPVQRRECCFAIQTGGLTAR